MVVFLENSKNNNNSKNKNVTEYQPGSSEILHLYNLPKNWISWFKTKFFCGTGVTKLLRLNMNLGLVNSQWLKCEPFALKS